MAQEIGYPQGGYAPPVPKRPQQQQYPPAGDPNGIPSYSSQYQSFAPQSQGYSQQPSGYAQQSQQSYAQQPQSYLQQPQSYPQPPQSYPQPPQSYPQPPQSYQQPLHSYQQPPQSYQQPPQSYQQQPLSYQQQPQSYQQQPQSYHQQPQSYPQQQQSYPQQPQSYSQQPQDHLQQPKGDSRSSQDDPSPEQQQAGQPNPVDKNLDPRGWALVEYGSPFAYSKDWAATREDSQLSGLPDRKFMLKLKQRFARSPGNVFGQPPPSFSRSPQQGWQYAPFQPFSLPAAEAQLADGFKPLYPGPVLADHDVSVADWARFLEDIQVAGRMSGPQQIISQVAPVTMHLGATGFLMTKAIEKHMKRGKEPAITEAVEMWQQHFFLRRGLDVYIRDLEGRMTGLGPGEPVPKSNHSAPTELDQNKDDLSSDSSDEVAHHHELSRKEQKRERDERKKKDKRDGKKRKEDEKKKKDEEKKNKKKPQYYLVVTPYQQ